ncbi:branched-chain amino acid transport system permease protein [Azospirillaceae bacterium]
MSSAFLQHLFSGLTIGAIYALAGLGFTIIYNASHVINFAQGEFIMIGAMSAVSLVGMGVPLAVAVPLAVGSAVLVGVAVARFAIMPARDASVVTLIIITIGTSIFLRGVAQVLWGKGYHALPSFSGDAPFILMGAALLPQSLWVLGAAFAVVISLGWFFGRTLFGKAMLATACNRFAAQLVGVRVSGVLLAAFALAAFMGAVGGVVMAPITFTSSDAGVSLGIKGFTAAVLGGLGSGVGAVVGGLVVGVAEAMSAGYLSSSYKEATAFVIILFTLFFMPYGLFGRPRAERV